jgi:HrpA-like RNA helicase
VYKTKGDIVIMLPIENFKEMVISTVNDNPVTIITADPGAGKSTMVPQYLLEHLLESNAPGNIVVTQPRRLAAAMLAEWVAQQYGCQLGETVGFRTGFERCDSPNTRLLFCTDGLELVRELTGKKQRAILVIDEVHEWTLSIEVLVAWVKKLLAEGSPMKVVLMSATLESEKLAAYFGDNVPVIDVPGRTHPVVMREDTALSMVRHIRSLVDKQKNVLVFLPGKKEIAEMGIRLSDLDAVILPLHSELTAEDQRRCFADYSVPKVVLATNIAQTSITIPGINAVVDSGLEKVSQHVDGVDGLYVRDCSRADCIQRKGRAGRVQPGMYFLCGASLSSRPEFSTAEIERLSLEQVVLRLASAGVNAGSLDFFHQPDRTALANARETLYTLNAMNQDGEITEIGEQMSMLPISARYARMIVEAIALEVADEVITLAALMEAGSLRDNSNNWRNLTKETSSDLFAELDIWKAGYKKSPEEMLQAGINPRAYYRAMEIRSKLRKAIPGELRKVISSGNKAKILRACLTGMVDHIYRKEAGAYINGSQTPRSIDRRSVTQAGKPEFVIAIPRDTESKTERGSTVRRMLTMVSDIGDPFGVIALAPHLVRRESSWRTDDGVTKKVSRIFVGNSFIGEKVTSFAIHPQTSPEALGW